ncbi:glycosyltransferase [Chelativorans sp. Marseille-P2723]|uniref:glycosyltransferase n=1 Tax=Chelativorans sp. Marseille-P2723 TaxID=2709133 RepID=UPI00156FABA2|nr:glycosyltransferase [Chelativorans sp. Marseille-P2723]
MKRNWHAGACAPAAQNDVPFCPSYKEVQRITPSSSAEWRPILDALGVSDRTIEAIEARAKVAGVPFQVELLASGAVGEGVFYRALANHLRLGFRAEIPPESLLMREEQCRQALRRPGGIRLVPAAEGPLTVLLIAPDRLDINALRRFMRRYPDIAEQIRIVPPLALRRAVQLRARESLLRLAVSHLFDTAPHLSARFVLNSWQGIALGALLVTFLAGLLLASGVTLLILHLLLSILFFGCVVLRFMVSQEVRSAPEPVSLKATRTEEMPVYTVLVALYQEAEIVPDLLMALSRIVWPRSKLEIKLVCEEDDHETLEAIRAQELRSYIEVIEVPRGGPRTKPKALSYALPMTTGELVVLYDAEDRPHPFQLVEAWQRFCECGDNLACVQAPLVITNGRQSWLSTMFAFEYSALFQGILPWLARRNLVLPLGGTSNHFRRSVLEGIGGWDPCNVTEDADLGLRLSRHGYNVQTITYPTYEDAPTKFRVWLPQRTRWFKGWAQTWLVHMRDVGELFRDLGPGSFVITQVLTAGMLVSALAYSVFAVTALALAAHLLAGGVLQETRAMLLLLDTVNIILGHAAFLAVGWQSLPRTERRGLWKLVLLTPIYWLLLSAAAWRALWMLYRKPHHWEKTPHSPSRPVSPQVRQRKKELRRSPFILPRVSVSREGAG